MMSNLTEPSDILISWRDVWNLGCVIHVRPSTWLDVLPGIKNNSHNNILILNLMLCRKNWNNVFGLFLKACWNFSYPPVYKSKMLLGPVNSLLLSDLKISLSCWRLQYIWKQVEFEGGKVFIQSISFSKWCLLKCVCEKFQVVSTKHFINKLI